jgi:retron-type reverse transcriptase
MATKARACKRHRFRDLYRHLDAEFLLHGWGDLRKGAFSGVDTVQAHAVDLHANLRGLAERGKAKRYRAKGVRRVYIPKDNGKERPLGLPAFEDKLVQRARAKLLTAVYEQDLLACSYGYRPGRGALDAVRGLCHPLHSQMA